MNNKAVTIYKKFDTITNNLFNLILLKLLHLKV